MAARQTPKSHRFRLPSSPSPVRIIPRLAAGHERALLTNKGLRVSAPELLEPGRELMLSLPSAEFIHVDGQSGRGLWWVWGARRWCSGRRRASLAPWRRASRVAYRREESTRRLVKRASHAVDKGRKPKEAKGLDRAEASHTGGSALAAASWASPSPLNDDIPF